MAEILSIIVSAVCIVWAVYGIVVFWRWDKIAKKTDAVLDEARELYRNMEEGGEG